MTCTTAHRERVRDAAAALDDHPEVAAHDTLEPDVDPSARWTLELVIAPGHAGVPSPVLRTLARHGLAVRDVAAQGYYWQAVAVADR